jgi:hypothetical protein
VCLTAPTLNPWEVSHGTSSTKRVVLPESWPVRVAQVRLAP